MSNRFSNNLLSYKNIFPLLILYWCTFNQDLKVFKMSAIQSNFKEIIKQKKLWSICDLVLFILENNLSCSYLEVLGAYIIYMFNFASYSCYSRKIIF